MKKTWYTVVGGQLRRIFLETTDIWCTAKWVPVPRYVTVSFNRESTFLRTKENEALHGTVKKMQCKRRRRCTLYRADTGRTSTATAKLQSCCSSVSDTWFTRIFVRLRHFTVFRKPFLVSTTSKSRWRIPLVFPRCAEVRCGSSEASRPAVV